MRRRPLSVMPRAIPEGIGLHADADGAGVRVQWDRKSRQVLNADHATLFIEDGTERSQLDLTGRQLDGSTVMYLPKSERVNFRLEVYRGGQSSSDSTDFSLPPGPQSSPPGDGARHRGAGAPVALRAYDAGDRGDSDPTGPRAASLRDRDDSGAGGAGTTQRKPAGQVHQ